MSESFFEFRERLTSAGHRDLHELFRVRDGKRPKHHGVDQRKDRRVRPDAQRERQHCDERERGAVAQHANRVARVVDHRVEPGKNVGVACFLLLRAVVAESSPRFALRLLAVHAGGDEIIGSFSEMKCELAIDVARVAVRAEQIGEATSPGHG